MWPGAGAVAARVGHVAKNSQRYGVGLLHEQSYPDQDAYLWMPDAQDRERAARCNRIDQRIREPVRLNWRP